MFVERRILMYNTIVLVGNQYYIGPTLSIDYGYVVIFKATLRVVRIILGSPSKEELKKILDEFERSVI